MADDIPNAPDFSDFPEWLKAVKRALDGGPVDPRLGEPLPMPEPLTADEFDGMKRLAEVLNPDPRRFP